MDKIVDSEVEWLTSEEVKAEDERRAALGPKELWGSGNYIVERSIIEDEAGSKMTDEEWNKYTANIRKSMDTLFFTIYSGIVDAVAGRCVHEDTE